MQEHISIKPASMSTVPPTEDREEIQGFTYNALAILGPNYFTRKWLPKKGPYFYAFVQCMRAHVFWDFETHEQKNKVFFEADTIAQMCGMSRATVFRLLNDPDMELFVKRVPWRRWDKALHKELQTANRYMVAMDDPPVDEADRAKVRQAQAQLEAMQRGETLIEDDDRPVRRSRSTPRKSSESHCETLIGVALRDSDSRLTERHEDRDLINLSDGEFTSICTKGDVGAGAIRNDQPLSRTTQGREVTTANETNKDAQQSNQIALSDMAAPGAGALQLVGAACLSESETWKAQARAALERTYNPATRRDELEHHLQSFNVADIPGAVERVLSAHASAGTPVEVFLPLVRLASRRAKCETAKTNQQTGQPKIPNPGGYLITTICNLAREAKGVQFDLAKLEKKTAQMEVKYQAQVLPENTWSRQTSAMPRSGASQRLDVRGLNEPEDDYYARFRQTLR